jgi:hypothetical protein
MTDGTSLPSDEARAIAEEAYVFAFPMLMGYRYAFGTFLVPSLPSYRGPANEMHGTAATLGPTFKDVITPNADTPYSMALLDLRVEPIVLEVPEVRDRYYVMQLVDLYGTNPHYVGSRTTGSDAGSYLIAGPRWDGETPEGLDDVLRCETELVFIIGRTQLFGPDDVANVAALMSLYRVRPLSAWQGGVPQQAPAYDWPVWDDAASHDERFIGYVNRLLEWCQPPHPSEVELLQRYSSIGIGAGLPFDADGLDDETRAALHAGVRSARAAIEARIGEIGAKVNGWAATSALGSRDFFDGDYLLRAAGAMAGWGGNDEAEAFYPIAREDSEGRPLDGSERYRLTLETLPPARAFWSVTMYDTSYDGTAGYLVENPIDRYLVNATTEGLVRGADGSLTIVMQRERPDDEAEAANWLPTPDGPFYVVMRIYWPEEAALDGTWEPPPIVRA